MSRRQAQRWGAQDEVAYEPAYQEQVAAPPPPDPIEQLKRLGELHEQGILTDEEFASQKARLLNS